MVLISVPVVSVPLISGAAESVAVISVTEELLAAKLKTFLSSWLLQFWPIILLEDSNFSNNAVIPIKVRVQLIHLTYFILFS